MKTKLARDVDNLNVLNAIYQSAVWDIKGGEIHTDKEHVFEIPLPPSANNYWTISNNRFATTQEAKNYKKEIFYRLSNLIPLRGDICLNITIFRRIRRGDLDNFLKVMLDALNGIVYLDDSQIVEIHAFREDDKENPRVHFYAYEREPCQPSQK